MDIFKITETEDGTYILTVMEMVKITVTLDSNLNILYNGRPVDSIDVVDITADKYSTILKPCGMFTIKRKTCEITLGRARELLKLKSTAIGLRPSLVKLNDIVRNVK